MQPSTIRAARLAAHRLTAPAASVAAAADHMLAVQSQDFRGGRWALGVRTRGTPTVADVDAAFDVGAIVRSWTMRGTIHTVPARDLGWMLQVSGERQLRHAAPVHRREGIDSAELAKAERVVRAALRGGGRLVREELFVVLEAGGVATAGQRGYHVLVALSARGVVCQGPVAERPGALAREQHIVLLEEWIADAAWPADPHAELFARYVTGHGPASAADFSWWSGLPMGVCRAAAEAAGDRVQVVAGEPLLYAAARGAPRRSPRAPRVVALPPFDEYYLSYADRTLAGPPALLDRVGPGRNGMVAAVLIADGELIGRWTHSVAIGRHAEAPVPELFSGEAGVDADAVAEGAAAALARYRDFITG